ncbi:MAG: mandelate racemase/muconate lactonizing enzyme family protein [Anaerolineae bacterium]|nr:mandelate racemase/muconate lactonizing enzyme family protein [Anaerolineae bacterium]
MSDAIIRVEALRVGAGRDYQATAGLRAPQVGAGPHERAVKALDANTGRHLCVYGARVETLLVKITTASGLVGWGEAHSPPVPRVSQALIEDLLAPQLLGRDPLAVEAHWDRLYHSMRLRGHATGFMLEALAGVDLALWDLAGKLLGQPLYRLLGGPFGADEGQAPRIRCYASGVPGATLEERLQAAERFIALGYTAIKLSIGRGPLDEDLAQVEAVADAIKGRADLLVDAHGCYDARSVVPAARRMEAAGVAWLEDPLAPEDVEGYAALCRAVDIPIANGETECTRWQFHQKLARGAADVILPDICRAGGISEGRRIAWVADLFHTPWCAHVSSGSWIHLVAALHLAAATPNFLICEYPNPLSPNELGDPLLQKPLRYADGHLQVPDGPGLGIEIDEAALAEHTVG